MLEAKVTLVLPGYGVAALPVDVDNPDVHSLESAQVTSIAQLQWLDGQVQKPWQAQLSRLLGLLEETGDTLPLAQFSGHKLETDKAIVCVAPIHLKADRDTASLIPPQQLGLRDAEADDLIGSVNTFLKDDGIEIFRDSECGWFITGMDGQNLKSFPPAFLAHRSASAFMPAGEDGGRWRRLMTEIQMLLHMHPVNILRESQGKLPVNSLWFWGGALLAKPALNELVEPTTHASSDAQATHIYAQDSYSALLSAHMGVQCKDLGAFDTYIVDSTATSISANDDASNNDNRRSITNVVVIDTSLIDAWLAGDESGTSDAKSTIDSRWIEPLIKEVERGHLQQLEIFTEDGQYGLCNAAVLEELARQYADAHPPWWKRVFARFHQ